MKTGGAKPRLGTLSARELSHTTWDDFERLFAKHNGVGGCWCMFYRRTGSDGMKEVRRSERSRRNKRDMKSLVKEGRSHGTLVYSDGLPVGWCQYGRGDEFPRIDRGRNYAKLGLERSGEKLWRITCFVVDRDLRRVGVAKAALSATIDSIKKKGGGTVEAYPVTDRSAEAYSGWSNWLWFGTQSMFEREMFRVAGKLGPHHLLMRRNVVPIQM